MNKELNHAQNQIVNSNNNKKVFSFNQIKNDFSNNTVGKIWGKKWEFIHVSIIGNNLLVIG